MPRLFVLTAIVATLCAIATVVAAAGLAIHAWPSP